MALKIIVLAVTLCSIVVGYQRFTGLCWDHIYGGPMKLWYPTTTLQGLTTRKNWTDIYIQLLAAKLITKFSVNSHS